MRKITTLTLASMLLFPTSSVLTSCSNDDLNEDLATSSIENVEVSDEDSQASRCFKNTALQMGDY